LPLTGTEVDVELRFFVFLAEPVHQFVTGSDTLRERRMGQRRYRIGK
jgi:hypothetical protein